MDIWRYSDWWGLGEDARNSMKHIWHWRDWIVESLNADQGYDQMLREMLAADELYPEDQHRLRAGGFLSRQYFKFNRTSWMDETVEHTAKSMLGLTFNCAKCHDHKYDPFSQADYYRFRAIFEPYQVRLDAIDGQIDFEKTGFLVLLTVTWKRRPSCTYVAMTEIRIRRVRWNRLFPPSFRENRSRLPLSHCLPWQSSPACDLKWWRVTSSRRNSGFRKSRPNLRLPGHVCSGGTTGCRRGIHVARRAATEPG